MDDDCTIRDDLWYKCILMLCLLVLCPLVPAPARVGEVPPR